MWKYVLIVLSYLITLEVGKCGNVEMWKYVFLNCLCLITLEVWKCGNVEMWKYVFLVLIYLNSGSVEVWKCGNVEICLHCLHLDKDIEDIFPHFHISTFPHFQS